jgi:hypothetical protein
LKRSESDGSLIQPIRKSTSPFSSHSMVRAWSKTRVSMLIPGAFFSILRISFGSRRNEIYDGTVTVNFLFSVRGSNDSSPSTSVPSSSSIRRIGTMSLRALGVGIIAL